MHNISVVKGIVRLTAANDHLGAYKPTVCCSLFSDPVNQFAAIRDFPYTITALIAIDITTGDKKVPIFAGCIFNPMESLVIDFAEGFVTVEVNINLPDEVVVGTVSCQRVLAVVNDCLLYTSPSPRD